MRIANIADHPEHMDVLVSWHRQEWGEEWADQVRHSACRDRIPTTFVAIEGDQPLGSSMLVVHDMTTRRDLTPWLGGVYVEPMQRGRGIATALITHAMEEARRIGVARLWLYTVSSRSLYERLGWRFAEAAEYEGEPVTIMALELVSARTTT